MRDWKFESNADNKGLFTLYEPYADIGDILACFNWNPQKQS